MTTLFMDPFTQYGGIITHMLDGPYATTGLGDALVVPTWDTSGQVTYERNSSSFAGGILRRVFPATKTAIVYSFHFAIDALPANDDTVQICDWRNSGNTVLAVLWLGSTGRIFLQVGSTQFSTDGPVVVPKNFHHLEMLLDYSGETFTLRVDDPTGTGTPEISATSIGVSGGPLAQMGFATFASTGATFYIKDLIVRDTLGSVNNGFNGEEAVVALFANADTTTAGWTPNFYQEFGLGILANLGGSSSVYTASSTSTDLGSGDFTIEGFYRFNTSPPTAGYDTLMSKWDSANNKRSWRLIYGGTSFNTNSLQFDISTDGVTPTTMIKYPWSHPINTWFHIALVRASGQLLLFVNGNQLGLPITDSNSYYVGTEPMGIGGEIQGTNTLVSQTSFMGWMDETRLTVGYARYTASFTPPTVAFPRGSVADPEWSLVALLSGYESGVLDESSYTRTLSTIGSASRFLVTDGPLIGDWSTLGANKIVPDDNTSLNAALLAATNILTMTSQPANNDTVTVGTKAASTAAVYTFKTALTGSAFEVLIDTTAQNTLLNLFNAVNAGPGIGVKYGTGTTLNLDVSMNQLPVGQLQAVADIAGTAGNSIASTATGSAAHWATSALTGGADIPGPSDFLVQRPAPTTTNISAIQLNNRMWKSDSGVGTVQPDFVGPLGGVAVGTAHALTITPTYYVDIIEIDPDTSGPISPTTLTNGRLRLNRTA